MNGLKWITLSMVIFSSVLLACEDTVPGALPPGYFGGIVEPFRETKGATGSETAAKSEGNEGPQYFFEAIYRGNELRLYALAIVPPKTALFTKLSPQRELSEIRAEIEYPWEGKTEELSLTTTDDAIIARIDAHGTHRFIVHLRAVHGGKTKFVNLQIENGD